MVPGSGALRLTRGVLFALAAVGLASAAHLAGGETPSPVVALGAVLVVAALADRLAGRRRGPLALFAGLDLTQLGLHLTFMAAAAGTACTASPGSSTSGASMASMAAMGMDDGHDHLAMRCSGEVARHAAGWPTPGMLALHLLAAALTAALLARGEAALWALAAGLAIVLTAPGPALRLLAVRRLPVRPSSSRRPLPAVHRRTQRRRGPPLLLAAR